MSNPEHARQVVCDLVLWLVLAVHGVNELIECLLHRVHVDLVLDVHTLGKFVRHVTVHVLARRDQVLLDPRQRVMLLHLQVDYLVRYDTHSLQREGLHARPRETLDDPALGLLLIRVDLFLDQLNHDLIIDYSNKQVYC